jgi:hypothetical protein
MLFQIENLSQQNTYHCQLLFLLRLLLLHLNNHTHTCFFKVVSILSLGFKTLTHHWSIVTQNFEKSMNQSSCLGELEEVISFKKIAKFFLLRIFLAKYKCSSSFLFSSLRLRFCLYILTNCFL